MFGVIEEEGGGHANICTGLGGARKNLKVKLGGSCNTFQR